MADPLGNTRLFKLRCFLCGREASRSLPAEVEGDEKIVAVICPCGESMELPKDEVMSWH